MKEKIIMTNENEPNKLLLRHKHLLNKECDVVIIHTCNEDGEDLTYYITDRILGCPVLYSSDTIKHILDI